jgi:hypothetical protein
LPPTEESAQESNQEKLHHHMRHSTIGKNANKYSYEMSIANDMDKGTDTPAFVDASPAY